MLHATRSFVLQQTSESLVAFVAALNDAVKNKPTSAASLDTCSPVSALRHVWGDPLRVWLVT